MDDNTFQSFLRENKYNIETSTSLCFDTEVNCEEEIIKSAEQSGDNLKKYGINWKYRKITKDITGVSRFFHKPEATFGAFYTHLWSLKNPSTDPREILELEDFYPKDVSFNYKRRFKILKGCEIAIGYLLQREVMQIYVPRNLIGIFVKEDGPTFTLNS